MLLVLVVGFEGALMDIGDEESMVFTVMMMDEGAWDGDEQVVVVVVMRIEGEEKERRYIKREDGNIKTRGRVYKRDRLGVAILIDLRKT